MSKSTFQQHYEKFRKSGGTGGMMVIDDVGHADMAAIVGEVFGLFKLTDDMDGSYIRVLSKYGIVCPHPPDKRLYEGIVRSKKPVVNYRWYDCEMCKCSVLNEHWMKFVREEEDERRARDVGR